MSSIQASSPQDWREMENQPEPIYGDDTALSAHFELGKMDMPTVALGRIITRAIREYDTRDEEKLSPDELNKRYPGLSEQFKEPMNLYIADDIAQSQYERQDLHQKIKNGPSTLASKGLGFASTMVAQMVDPTNLLLGYGVGKFIGSGVMGARMSKIMGTAEAAPSLGQTAARSAIEGVVTTAGAEIPVAISASQDQMEYRPEDAFINLAAGTLGNMVMSMGFQMLGRALKPHEVSVLNDVLSAQADKGYPLNPEPILQAFQHDNPLANEMLRPDHPFIDAAKQAGVHAELDYYTPKQIYEEFPDLVKKIEFEAEIRNLNGFDQESIMRPAQELSETELRDRVSEETIKLTDSKQKIDFDPEAQKALDETKSLEELVDNSPEGMQKSLDESFKFIKESKDRGDISEMEFNSLSEELAMMDEDIKLDKSMLEAAVNCVARSIA